MIDTSFHQIDLQAAATQTMLKNGFQPEWSAQVQKQLNKLKPPPPQVTPSTDVRDLRGLLWSSIDNDTSRDLDQIEVAERLAEGAVQRVVWRLGGGGCVGGGL